MLFKKNILIISIIIILIVCFVLLLCSTPVFAKEMTSEVTDKKIVHPNSGYMIHTRDFGDIQVTSKEYDKTMIGDNITFNTKNDFGLYTILKINGRDIQNG